MCRRRLGSGAQSAGRLCFGPMSNTKVKPDCIQKNRTDIQTPMTSVKQHSGFKLDQPQAEDQPWASQALVRGLIERGQILWHAQRRTGTAFDVKTKEKKMSPLEVWQLPEKISCLDLYKPSYLKNRTVGLIGQRPVGTWTGCDWTSVKMTSWRVTVSDEQDYKAFLPPRSNSVLRRRQFSSTSVPKTVRCLSIVKDDWSRSPLFDPLSLLYYFYWSNFNAIEDQQPYHRWPKTISQSTPTRHTASRFVLSPLRKLSSPLFICH